jgi:ParB family chromosome partitioning protein
LGEVAQAALGSSQITAGHARSLLAITDADAQATMVARVIKNELSVRATEDAVKAFLEPKPVSVVDASTKVDPAKPRLRPVPDASVAELEQLLEDYLDTRVHVDLKGRNGRIIIDFADLDDLERLYITISQTK